MPRLIDWATLLKVDPDLPSKLNRAFFSMEAESKALRALIDELDLPDLGPGAGTYGGSPDFIESITLDAQWRVTALVASEPSGAGGASIDGSVLSMVGPGGASNPVVAYDFTKFNPALTNAQNITAANLSGNSAFDLAAGSAGTVHGFLAKSGDPQGTPYGWTPLACRSDGGAVFTGSGTDFVETAASPSALQFLGAMTAEWLGYITVIPGGASDVRLFQFQDNSGSEVEAENDLYRLVWINADTTWKYQHENGAGTDCTAGFFNFARLQFTEWRTNPQHVVLTRSAAGDVNMYINGRKVASQATPAPNALPTGGTASNLRIGVGSDAAVRMANLGFRLFGVELTAAQVRASYQRTFFGVSV